jgi:hypothetical protein
MKADQGVDIIDWHTPNVFRFEDKIGHMLKMQKEVGKALPFVLLPVLAGDGFSHFPPTGALNR